RDLLPVAQAYGMGVLPWSPLAGGWLSGAFGEGKDNTSRRSARLPERYDLSNPANQKKLEIVTELATVAKDANLTLIEMAIAFVLQHPAISAAIIGPRTMEHLNSQLPAADVLLESSVLDRIDELVAPGTNVNPGDAGYIPAALRDPALRRRPNP
ncbi:MAG TPA: aldo/keto reductase, partial [Acidimicrobiales bacterium]|nr:aldo/keto reductase [Acidimicrobiales bacterium]